MLLTNLVLAFVTGLVSSFGHCVGMCGGLVALYSARQSALISADGNRPSVLVRIGLLSPLHLGRIMTYTFLGGMIGFAGALLEQVGGLMGWQGLFSIIVGLLMIGVALSLMGILPPLERVLAAATSRASPAQQMRGLFGQRRFAATLGLGLLWGFLPCGLVFAMLVVAAGTQTLWGGALTMLAFGLGTIPTLLGVGLATNLLGPKFRGRLQRLAGILILLFALQTILRGLAAANLIPSLILGPVMLW